MFFRQYTKLSILQTFLQKHDISQNVYYKKNLGKISSIPQEKWVCLKAIFGWLCAWLLSCSGLCLYMFTLQNLFLAKLGLFCIYFFPFLDKDKLVDIRRFYSNPMQWFVTKTQVEINR